MKRVVFVAILAAAFVAASAEQERKHFNSYIGKEPPELKVAKDDWITVKNAPELGKLKGKVVWLEFSFTT